MLGRVSMRWLRMSLAGPRRAVRWALLGGLTLGTSNCDHLKEIFYEPPVPDKHPTHDLVVERGIARFNGTPIAPGVPLSRWIELFGKPDRVAGVYHLWDRLGLGAAGEQASGEDPTKLIVDCMIVVYLPSSIFTRDAFVGRTLVEGAPLYAGANINHINRRFQQDCEGTGTAFVESVLPGSYECDTLDPPREYELTVYVEHNAAKVRWFNFCDGRD